MRKDESKSRGRVTSSVGSLRLINVYLWILRRKWRVRVQLHDLVLAGDGVEMHYSSFDRAFQPYERKFSQASVTVKGLYWGCVVLAAIAIYLFYSR